MKLFYLITIFLTFTIQAQEDCESDSKNTLQNQAKEIKATLTPQCISPDGHSWDEPEKMAQEITKNLSEEEVAARLVFAEALASGCKIEELKDVATGIAWVVKNRLKAQRTQFGKTYKEIVFKKYQFRSTLGGCDVAKRKEFLCPTTIGKDWEELWSNIQQTIASNEEQANPFPNTYNYFFDNHFKNSENCSRWHGKIPDWAKANSQIEPKGISPSASCVRFFKI